MKTKKVNFNGRFIDNVYVHESIFTKWFNGKIIEACPIGEECTKESRVVAYDNGIDYNGVHYVKLGRSASKAKNGNCLFIDEEHAKEALDFLTMGYNVEDISSQAYMALVMSTIVKDSPEIALKPEDILVVKDQTITIKEDIFDVSSKDGTLVGQEMFGELESTLWDGMSLIQGGLGVSEWASLRNHWFKTCAFEFDLARYFRDHGIEIVTDIWGVEHKVEDVKLITTENSIKWYKQNKTIDGWNRWVEHIHKYNTPFCKNKEGHESKTHIGDNIIKPMSYQMVNTLENKNYKSIMRTNINFVDELNRDTMAFTDYLYSRIGYCSYNLMWFFSQYESFVDTIEYQKKKKLIISDIKEEGRKGRIHQVANNMTLCSNPIALMRYVCTGEVESEFSTGNCYCDCKELGAEFAGFRSPHNVQNNTYYFEQEHIRDIDKYMSLGDDVLVVDSFTDIQARLSGCDYDSDFVYCTSQYYITKWVRDYKYKFPTIRNSVKQLNSLNLSMAEADDKIYKNSDTGSSANLAMWLVSMYHHTDDKKWIEAACMASTITQLAVDSTKKVFEIDPHRALQELRIKTGYSKGIRPNYWQYTVARGKESKETVWIDCPQEHYYNPTHNGRSSSVADFLYKVAPRYKAEELGTIRDLIDVKNHKNKDVDALYDMVWVEGQRISYENMKISAMNAIDAYDANQELRLSKDEKIKELRAEFDKIKVPKREKVEQLLYRWLNADETDWVLGDLLYEIAPSVVASCCYLGMGEGAKDKPRKKKQPKKRNPYRRKK